VEAALLRTLQDQSILSWVVVFSFAAIFSMLLLKAQNRRELREEVVHVILPASILIQGYYLLFIAAIIALLYFLRKKLYPSMSFYTYCVIAVIAFNFL
jgi:hypothetical protein